MDNRDADVDKCLWVVGLLALSGGILPKGPLGDDKVKEEVEWSRWIYTVLADHKDVALELLEHLERESVLKEPN